MTELHPDRLTTVAASPDRRRSRAGRVRPKSPEGRQGKTSPSAETASQTTPTTTAQTAAHATPRATAPRPRPTPHPRSGSPSAGSDAPALEVRAVVAEAPAAEPGTAVAEAAELAGAVDAQARAALAAAPLPAPGTPGEAVAETADEQVPAATGRRSPVRGIRPPRRRPAFYVAAALVGAVGVATFSAGDRVAQADGPEPVSQSVSQSVSVARELGLGEEDVSAAAAAAGLRSDAAVLLGEVTASRTAREAEEAAAAQVQADADRVAAEAAAAAAAEAARPKAVLPVAGGRLTSGFGPRWGRMHAGIDLAAPMLTPEYAAADGVVLEAGPAGGYGNAVYVQHDNGDVTVYGHMEEILVQPGQVVRAGDTIALLGNQGQSTGPHLHFEVRVGGIDGQQTDPVPWLRERGVAI
jgi:murein DD-endopeptidase MepM/ murein hydrolase activator NlpD